MTINRIVIEQREDIDVDASQNVVILAETHVYFGSSIDIHIESVQAGDVIRIKGSDGIYNATSGTDAIIIGDDLILEASEESIGTALQPIYTDLFAESILTATAGEDIYIVEKAGNINVGTIYSESECISQLRRFDS